VSDQVSDNECGYERTSEDGGGVVCAQNGRLRTPADKRNSLTRKRSLVQTQYRPPSMNSP
jgi:hypothetical protein